MLGLFAFPAYTSGLADSTTAELRRPKPIEQASSQTCRIEFTPIRIKAIDARSKAYGAPATFGVFHQAIRETESVPQIPRPTYFRIWQMPLFTGCVIGHRFPVFSISPPCSCV
jgi:hypothetical protein